MSANVRYGPVQVVLDAPDNDVLLAWATNPHQRLATAIVFLAANGGRAVETLHLPAAYCVSYAEEFRHGDTDGGAYVCQLTLADPDGWTLQPGGPAAAFAPAAREHGSPPVVIVPTRWKGGSGPDGLGDAIGKFSGRRFDPDNCGGPILGITWQDATITAQGIATVQKHVGRHGEDPENEAMLSCLHKINQGNLPATDWDKRFYTHELREYERYRAMGIADGVDPGREAWNNAHTTTLEDFGLADYSSIDGKHNLYHPEI